MNITLKDRLIAWLIGPDHTVIHRNLLREYERVSHMTPFDYLLYYEQRQAQQSINRWMRDKQEDEFTKHVPLFSRLASLREYFADKDARN